MPYSDPKVQKEAQHESYIRNKEKVRLSSKQQREANRKWLAEQKAAPCMDCEVAYPPYVMEFHHRDPEEKVMNVSMMIIMKGRQAVVEEIAKCDLVCANCHRVREHDSSQ